MLGMFLFGCWFWFILTFEKILSKQDWVLLDASTEQMLRTHKNLYFLFLFLRNKNKKSRSKYKSKKFYIKKDIKA